MKYFVLLAILGAAQVVLAGQLGVPGILLAWSGLSFLVVAAGYAWFGPGLLGKRSDGALPWPRVLLLWPYFAATWGLWRLQRFLTKEPCCNEVAPGVWLGRRPFAHELPANVTLIVDLTAEFPERNDVMATRQYLCVPTLDAAGPDRKRFLAAVHTILASEGAVYLHCALGHGRSATLAAAVLLARGLARDAAQAEELVAKARPAVGITTEQRKLLATVQGIAALNN